jgi:NADPH:quinone reductase-like Zn-dependent oxidoreductase
MSPAETTTARSPSRSTSRATASTSGHVDLAIELGITPERIDTIVADRAAARHGAKTDRSAECASANVLAELAERIANGKLEIPIAHTYQLEQVRDAYHELE